MAEEGIDVSHQPVRQVTPDMVDQADAIYLIHKYDIPDYLLQSDKVVKWDIEDPFDMPIAEIRHIQQQVKQHVLDILPV